jgi:hypothetical protein
VIDLLQTASGAIQISAASRPALDNATTVTARNFLAAGGHLTLTEWATLSDSSRRALVAAQDEIEFDRARLIAEMLVRALAAPAPAAPGSPRIDAVVEATVGPSASAAAQERAALAAAGAAGGEA